MKNNFYSFLFLSLCSAFCLLIPNSAEAAPLQNASLTLSNPRPSWRAFTSPGRTGDTTIRINASTDPSNTTEGLLTGDEICFKDSPSLTCTATTRYEVVKVLDESSFTITPPLNRNLEEGASALSPQSDRLTIAFTTVGVIPTGGGLDLFISPLGFDIADLSTGQIFITGCAGSRWVPTAILKSSDRDPHRITIENQGAICPGNSVISVELGRPIGVTNSLSPSANIYPVTVKTYDSSRREVDEIILQSAFLPGLSVSATVIGGGEEIGLILYGYTSPHATVFLENVALEKESIADEKGYFSFTISAVSASPEACVSSKDQFGRISRPVCIPIASTKSTGTVGPVLLSPTVSLNSNNHYTGDEVFLSGQTIPDTNVEISFFIDETRSQKLFELIPSVFAISFPVLAAHSDSDGNFSLVLPSASVLFFRVFAHTTHLNEPSPQSNTLVGAVLPLWIVLLLKYLPLGIFALILSLVAWMHYRLFHPHRLALALHPPHALVVREEYPLLARIKKRIAHYD